MVIRNREDALRLYKALGCKGKDELTLLVKDGVTEEGWITYVAMDEEAGMPHFEQRDLPVEPETIKIKLKPRAGEKMRTVTIRAGKTIQIAAYKKDRIPRFYVLAENNELVRRTEW